MLMIMNLVRMFVLLLICTQTTRASFKSANQAQNDGCFRGQHFQQAIILIV